MSSGSLRLCPDDDYQDCNAQMHSSSLRRLGKWQNWWKPKKPMAKASQALTERVAAPALEQGRHMTDRLSGAGFRVGRVFLTRDWMRRPR